MSSLLVVPGITDENTLVRLARARKFTQYSRMVDEALQGRCPFCMVDRAYNQVVCENDFWYSWPSNPPEKNTRLHFLFVPKRHVKSAEELSDDELLEFWGTNGIRRRVHRMYGYESCGMLLRDGDATLSAGTIEHLHIHDMVPDGTGRVESPFYKGREEEEAGMRRAIVFEKMRQGENLETLPIDEQALVHGRLQ